MSKATLRLKGTYTYRALQFFGPKFHDVVLSGYRFHLYHHQYFYRKVYNDTSYQRNQICSFFVFLYLKPIVALQDPDNIVYIVLVHKERQSTRIHRNYLVHPLVNKQVGRFRHIRKTVRVFSCKSGKGIWHEHQSAFCIVFFEPFTYCPYASLHIKLQFNIIALLLEYLFCGQYFIHSFIFSMANIGVLRQIMQFSLHES
nr:MAG TPA: hypothetical protein [Caudoviricetes sp.]